MTGVVVLIVLDGPVNVDWFEADVTMVLVPELHAGYIVVMARLSSQRRGIRRLLLHVIGHLPVFLKFSIFAALRARAHACAKVGSPADFLLFMSLK